MAKVTKVRTVNTGKKKTSKKKGRKKNVAKKKRKGRRRRRNNPSSSPRRRRRSGGRRRNPGGLGNLIIDPRGALSGSLARLLGKVVPTIFVRRFGDGATTEPTSWSQGTRWTMKNYFIALLSGGLVAEVVGRTMSPDWAKSMFVGTVDLLMSKALWHEIVTAIPGGPGVLGAVPSGLPRNIAQQMRPGDIADDGSGNRYLMQRDGRIVAMMGMGDERSDYDRMLEEPDDAMGELVQETRMGDLVPATRMGNLVPASRMGAGDDDDWRPDDRMSEW